MHLIINNNKSFFEFHSITANISNWTAKLPNQTQSEDAVIVAGAGGFFAFGIEGMMHGAAIFAFLFVAFDAMVSSNTENDPEEKHQYIDSFKKTVPSSVMTINGLAFVCLLGITVALTLIQPYFLLVCF